MVLNRENARHETQLHRLLSEILDDKYLAQKFLFKGGTCARLMGLLDRFSVDLDFDLSEQADRAQCRQRLAEIFDRLNLEIKDKSQKALQFFLRYPAPENERNMIKLDILDEIYEANQYTPLYLEAIGRTAICQSPETMFAHKLIAPTDRYRQRKSIAGRDIYDIHHFFMQGLGYRSEVIQERTGLSSQEYLQKLKSLIIEKVSDQKLDEDLNVLLDPDQFQHIRKHLKREVINFIDNEIERLKSCE